MKHILTWIAGLALAQALALSSANAGVHGHESSVDVQAAPVALIGVQGYDLVSYHQESGPVRGSGFHASTHDGVTYLFASEANQKTFAANPEKFLPAYGGYCAYGVAVGQKFAVDPLAAKIVDGKLYLNLNGEIQAQWLKDMDGFIEKADAQWAKIHRKTPAELAAK
ncbi:MAG: YHS domain-containing (seleno)protein [Opitutales bacterium]